MRLDGAYKQSKDIDSDNKDDLSGEEPHDKVGLKPPGRPVRHNIASQDLSVPVPIRGSLMSDKMSIHYAYCTLYMRFPLLFKNGMDPSAL